MLRFFFHYISLFLIHHHLQFDFHIKTPVTTVTQRWLLLDVSHFCGTSRCVFILSISSSKSSGAHGGWIHHFLCNRRLEKKLIQMNSGASVFSESGVQQMWKPLLLSVNTGNLSAGGATGRVCLKALVCPVVVTKYSLLLIPEQTFWNGLKQLISNSRC